MQPRGYTSGPGSLMDAVLRAAGLTNASDGRRMSAETLLRHPPDILVLPVAPENKEGRGLSSYYAVIVA
jgi:ABC-type Fe3+-hydroxamate transport system substrate-binding protein